MTLSAICLALFGTQAPQPASGLEWAARFWAEESVQERDEVAAQWIASGTEFQAAYDALRHGRNYSADAPTGYILRQRTGKDGQVHPYLILVPEDYTPSRAWPLRFQLHGGMGAEEWDPQRADWAGGWSRTESSLMVFPAGWRDSMWWQRSQAENFEAILRDLRATWNIDEDRVIAVGNSDGGAALFFLAMRMPDRFAGYVGHVAPPDRLVRADLEPDGQMHLDNLARQRFHLGYGAKDRLVPIKHLRRYMALFEAHGALLDWYVLEDRGHELQLSDERVDQFMRFIYGTRRDALPDRLSWSTERVDRYARRSWIRIDALVPDHRLSKGDRQRLLPRWGTPIQLRGKTMPRVPFGTLEVLRKGNRVEVESSGVAGFSLLLSPDEFDFSAPVRLLVNGELVRDAVPEPSIETLLHRAARDDDRATLFATEWTLR